MNRSLPASIQALVKTAPILTSTLAVCDDPYSRYGAPSFPAEAAKHRIVRDMAEEIGKIVPLSFDYDIVRRQRMYSMTVVAMTQAELEVLLARAHELGKAGK